MKVDKSREDLEDRIRQLRAEYQAFNDVRHDERYARIVFREYALLCAEYERKYKKDYSLDRKVI